MTEHSKNTTLTLMLIAVAGFSVTPVISKPIIDEVGLFLTQFLRFATIALFFPLAHFMITDKERVSLFELQKGDLLRLFLTSFFLVGSMVTFYLSYEYITVTRALVLSFSYPVITIILARIFLHEPIMGRDWIASGLTIAGLAFAYLVGNPGPSQLIGDGLAMLSAIFTASYIVINRYTSLRQIYYKQTFWLFLFGTLMMIPFFGTAHNLTLSSTISVKTALFLLILCFGLTLISYTFFTSASRHMKASAIGFFIVGSQVVSIALSEIFLGETTSFEIYVAGAFILGSAIISAYSFSHVFSFKNYVMLKVRNALFQFFSRD